MESIARNMATARALRGCHIPFARQKLHAFYYAPGTGTDVQVPNTETLSTEYPTQPVRRNEGLSRLQTSPFWNASFVIQLLSERTALHTANLSSP